MDRPTHEARWRRLLGDIDEPTAPFGLGAMPADGARSEAAEHSLEPDLSRRLRDHLEPLDVDVASFFHLAWAMVLARLCDRDDVVMGSALTSRCGDGDPRRLPADAAAVLPSNAPAGRPWLRSSESVAVPVSVWPLRVRVDETGVRVSLMRLERERREWREWLNREDGSAAPLRQREEQVAAAPLFTTWVDARRLDLSVERPGGPAQLAVSGADSGGPIGMTVIPAGDSFTITVRAPSWPGPRCFLDPLRRAVTRLVDALEDEPERALCDLDVMPGEERQRLLFDWNATHAPALQDTTVCDLLDASASAAPDALAVIEGDVSLTHAGLHAQANRLAHHLRALGVGPDTRVGVCMVRSVDLLTTLLAILKAGGAYVPLDPAYPAERLAYMLSDSAPAVVLTHARVPDSVQVPMRAALAGRPVLDLHAEAPQVQSQPATPPDPQVVGLLPSHLAYVTYTSGSTGQPKGVANTIAGLANRLGWFVQAFKGVPPITAMKTSICFVDSITEMLQTLAAGGRLVVFDTDTAKDTRRFAEQVRCHGVSKLVVVPSLLAQLLEADPQALASVRTLICSGERLAPERVAQCRQVHPGARLLNFYGSSEVNGDSTFHDCTADADTHTALSASPIGRPIANTRIYLLDARRRPVPTGVTGEVFVGGAGLARGYLGRADLTAERFLDDPFVEGGRLFKTGDLARYREDGTLEFMGRNDHQVKIRGFRIELGEIEAVIGKHPSVRKVCVMGREDVPGDKRLVAYLTADVPGSEIIDGLRQRIGGSLPDFMMPAHFVFLGAMPMTPTGKLDRQSLPLPDGAVRSSARPLVMPRDAAECSLQALWKDILRVEQIGVHDSFFDLGGNSLLAVRLQGRLEALFAARLPLNLILAGPTIAQLAVAVRGDAAAVDSLLSIRAGGAATPVFFVHDGFGETLVYRELAHRLRPEFPVYGLCPRSVAGISMVHTRIGEMASHYVARVRAAQPEGPYVLAGLCAGGVIAFEMARQLQEQGQRVGALVLIDSNDVSAHKRVGRYVIGRLRHLRMKVAQNASWSDPVGTLRAVGVLAAGIAGLALEPVKMRVLGLLGERKARRLRRCLDAGVVPPPSARGVSVDQIYNLAESDHHETGVLHADVTLVRATQGNGDSGDEPFGNLFKDPLLGWGRRVRGTLHCVDVPGGHYSMFQEPHVAVLAQTVQSCIDATQAPSFDGAAHLQPGTAPAGLRDAA